MATPEGLSVAEAAACRILVVITGKGVGYERDVADALRACARFESKVIGIGSAIDMPGLSLGERVYRSLDRLLFDRPRKARPANDSVVGGPTDLAAAASSFAPRAIVDLTGALSESIAPDRMPIVTLEFEGKPARLIDEAVRLRLGTPQGTARVAVHSQTAGTRRLLFAGECFIDHRSLVRSIELVVRKVPIVVQAGLARLSCPQDLRPVPDQVHRLRGAVTLIGALATSIFRRLVWRLQWRIVLFRGQPRDRLGMPWVTLQPDARAFWADPFLVVAGDEIHVFFEELPFASGKGRISQIGIDRNGNCGPPVVVLERPWHLSYPFVFEWAGKFYMIPESSANETVDLYECVGFPRQWRFVQTIIGGQRLADATIVNWQGRLWMFAAHGQAGASNYDELHIHWAHDLLGPWHPHLLNPVKIDAGSARPAGAMWVENGRIVRPTQDCRDRYGDGVAFQEVTVLDERRFEERPLHRLSVAEAGPGDAIHTFNAAQNYAAVDAARSCLRISWPRSLSLRRTGAAARAVGSAQTTSGQRTPQELAFAAPNGVLMVGTSPEFKGGIAAVVQTLREGGLFERARIEYVVTHVDAGAFSKMLQFARAVVATLRALLRGHVALVHAHVSFNASFWRKATLLWIARRFGVPTVFHLHSGGFDEFAARGGPIRRWCIRRSLRASSTVVVLSKHWRHWVEQFAPGSKVRVVANPVQVPASMHDRSKVAARAHAGRVLFLGKICDDKGTFDLLHAWQRFRQAAPGWRLAIGGFGEVDRFLGEAARIGVRDDIEYLGWVAGEAKARELARADIFVLPSYKEGMPVAILEAMAFGAAVIATPVGGVPDMMEADVHGVWVRPGDVAALADALVRLAGSPQLRATLAAASRKHVASHYATEKVVEQIVSLYRDVAANQNGQARW